MARFGSVGTQYFDSNGDPLSGGKLNFYEPSTTTRKDTFSDSAETSANTNPVILDAAGRQADIFFSGEAKAVLTDADDVQIDVTDPVGTSTTSNSLAAWSSSATYDLNDLVTGSDGNFYVSIVSSNSGNDPTSSLTTWMEVRFLNTYNVNTTYADEDVVITGDQLYVSLQSSNTNNTPSTSTAYWRPLGMDLWTENTIQVGAFTASVGRRYLIDTADTSAFTMTLPSPTVGDRIGFIDYAENFANDFFTIGRGGSEIMNLSEDMVCDVNYYSGELLYTSARGWILI